MTDIEARLEELRETDLFRRMRMVSGPQGPRVVLDGKPAALGDAIIVEGAAAIAIDIAPGSTVYVAYPGLSVIAGLLGPDPRSALLSD